MSRISKSLIVSFGIALGAAAPLHAQVVTNVTSELFAPGGLAPVDYAGVTSAVNGVGTFPFPSFQVSCLVATATGCTQGPVAATANLTGVSLVTGVSYSTTANAFTNSSTVSMSVTGTPAATPTGPLSVGVTAGDFRPLELTYSGSLPAPTGVVLDVLYSLNTTLTDNTTGSTADTSGSLASVSVMDPATYNPTLDANGLPTIELPFQATASQGNLYASGAPSSLGGIGLFTAAVDHLYWVEDFAQAGVSLPTGSTDDLDVTLSASADPTFSIDAAWLAANPQYTASDFSITQAASPVAVPEPPVVWLLLAGLGAVTVTLRGRRKPLLVS